MELQNELLRVEPDQFNVVREALEPYQSHLIEWLWKKARNQSEEDGARFQAGCALATYAADRRRWEVIAEFVANYLVTEVHRTLSPGGRPYARLETNLKKLLAPSLR